MDPTKRMTSDQALQDAYFHEEPLPCLEFVSFLSLSCVFRINILLATLVHIAPFC